MNLAIFDLDNTLLGGDSDYLWGQFLAEKGIVDAENYEKENQRFYDEYKAGTLDIYEFLAFSLKPLASHDVDQLISWRQEFMETKIKDIILPKARMLVEKHREKGDFILIITATNHFVTEPIAEHFDANHLLATLPEKINGRYTGKVAGIPCFREGKIHRLQEWLNHTPYTLEESHFYSDSFNDLPLLKLVTHPIAVDPDDTLRSHAIHCGWPVITLR